MCVCLLAKLSNNPPFTSYCDRIHRIDGVVEKKKLCSSLRKRPKKEEKKDEGFFAFVHLSVMDASSESIAYSQRPHAY